MSQRDRIRMNEQEIQAFLEEQLTLQVATIDHDGFPHVVPMWYAVVDGEIVFWTYTKSQKALNLRRDDRLTCLVETGERYEQLRGVQIKGHAVLNADLETVKRVAEAIYVRYIDGPMNDAVRQMIAAQAPKRVLIYVKPVETVSWDHRKLGSGL